MMAVDIAKLVEAARESNFVGFCTAVHLKKSGKAWQATLIGHDEPPSGKQPHGYGETPEEALQIVQQQVRRWILEKHARASDEAGKAKELLAALE